MVSLSRAGILATIDRMGGVAAVAPLLSLLPGAGSGTSFITNLLLTAEKEIRAGSVYVTIKAPIGGTTDIEIT